MNIIWKIKSFDQLSTSELYRIMKARVDVFIIEQNCPYPELDDYDQKAAHVWGELNNEIVAYCRIFEPGIKYEESSIGRVLTNRNYRGKNLGKSLMIIATNAIESRYNTNKIRISAQDYLLNFYKDFKFQDTGKKYLEDGIPHTEMLR